MTATETNSGLQGSARAVGARVHRIEDDRLLTGAGTFVADVWLPGMLHAFFVRSPMARARILGIDTSDALAAPGVHAVYTAAEIHAEPSTQWHTVVGPNATEVPRPPLAKDEVRFVGDPVALVIADDAYAAEDAAELVVVEYEPLPPYVDYLSEPGSDQTVHTDFPGNVLVDKTGPNAEEVRAVFDSAAHVVSATIHQQAHQPAPMETRGFVVDWRVGELTIYAATQSPHEVKMFAARLLGIPEHSVRVVARDTGGAFGLKIFTLREEMALFLAAPKLGRPLKWIEDRRENLISASQSRHEWGVAKLAVDDEGKILATSLDLVQDMGAYPTPSGMTAGDQVCTLYPGPYRVPLASFTSKAVLTNTVGRTAYRGPWMFESLAREMLMDIAARQLGTDPVELRRKNLLRLDEQPWTNPFGFVYEYMTPLETFELAINRLDYAAFRGAQSAAREQGRYLGVGISTYSEPTSSAFGMYATEGATMRIEPSGKVNVYLTGGSTGNSLETTVVQLAADALGMPIEDVHTIQGDTALAPMGAGTGGSRSAVMTAGAVSVTSTELKAKLIALAAHLLEASEEDIEIADGKASVRGTGAGMKVAELAQIAYFASEKLPPGMSPGLETTGRFKSPVPFSWANATHICTCEVDPVTGHVTVLRYIVAEDIGPMINPNVVEGQIAGGTVQGISGVLLEHLAYDEDGNPMASTFVDYLLPTATEVPDIEYEHLETPSPVPGGYKGVGEGGAIGAPAAVVNAIADALAPLGVTITDLPLTPARIVELVDSAAAG